jgi:hypothetical protein
MDILTPADIQTAAAQALLRHEYCQACRLAYSIIDFAGLTKDDRDALTFLCAAAWARAGCI